MVDADEFTRAYSENRAAVFLYLRRRLLNHDTAEDLTAETFARALARWDSYQEIGKSRAAWLMTIARNILFDHCRSSYFKSEVPTAEFTDGDESSPDAWTGVERRLDQELIRQTLSRLAESQRRCLELRFLAQRSIAETATALGLSQAAAKQLQFRAIAAARTHMSGAR